MKTTTQHIKQQADAPFQAKAKNQGTHGSILQTYKDKTAQRQSAKEEELLQGKFESVQKMELDEEEPLQGKFETTQLATEDEEEPLQRLPNNTGLPDNLKSGVENLSGYSMDDVKVHYNSSQPATLQAHAYAQGTDIHIAPGQEKHLPHEAWHVVQQKQGRVKPTMQMKGTVPVNDDTGLEKEADVMGKNALSKNTSPKSYINKPISKDSSLQLKPMPSQGLPETYNLYNSIEGAKRQPYDGVKPTFGKNLYKSRIETFMDQNGMVLTYTENGHMPVPRSAVQLDHNPSWNARVGDLLNFPLNKNDQHMKQYVDEGLYIKIDNNYKPTNYAARMYYNDYDTLFPVTGGINAAAGEHAVEAEEDYDVSFKLSAIKSTILQHLGSIYKSAIISFDADTISNQDNVQVKIQSTIDQLQNLKDNDIPLLYPQPDRGGLMLDLDEIKL